MYKQDIPDLIAGALGVSRGTALDMMREALAEQSAQQEPVAAEAWQQGYDQGVVDERTSEANIGVAGFGAKVNPARNNPYTTPQAQPAREWVGLTAAEVHEAFVGCLDKEDEVGLFAQTIEAKLKEKNTKDGAS